MTTWTLPAVDILDPAPPSEPHAVETNTQAVADALRAHGVAALEVDVRIGPQAVRYLVRLEPGVLPAKVEKAVPGVELALATPVRYAGTSHGHVVLEANRAERCGVTLRSVVADPACVHPGAALPIPVGVSIAGRASVADLARLPHLIVAGTTGSGKSSYLHAVVTSLLMRCTPDDLALTLIDPKHVELAAYEDAPHVHDFVTSATRAYDVLVETTKMMDARYAELRKRGVRDLDDYLTLPNAIRLERHVVVVEELADLLMSATGPAIAKRLERIAQLGRAAGIHLVVATQRPSAKVLPELLRANVPARAVFAVSTTSDGQVALGEPGATVLAGKGDGLFKTPGVGAPLRFQSPFVSAAERARVVEWWTSQIQKEPEVVEHVAMQAAEPVRREDPGATLRATLDLAAAQRDAERTKAMADLGIAPSYRNPRDVLAGYGFTPQIVDALVEVQADRISDLVVAKIKKELGL